ncbi:high-affinity branched-chain amino acid ABC transporter substrate-binding protein [Pontibacterium granulatum]|uniref:high-affinity branched-chain amino acid ABC transporter substrate-binding protein n=1 Tax=Pontibacterium granulatum TaxID=2036029 RepID=UPI00249B224B|nr:high-affinity branched-chain amino acid ABC transporter substrate-binding protein [Pontibacterium granulatum]MDI3323293.1 high-affinity branched-chain amino acid ABC transporter substrate-binding protein [Pontibacterium granulatum]
MKLTPSSFASLALSAVLSFSVQAAESVKIGIVGPFSGPLTQYGEMQLNGAHAAIDMINGRGGVNGRMLEAVEYDDVCEPKQAVTVANKIINSEVKFVVGHLCSSSTQPATDIYRDEDVLVITGSTNPGITLRGYSKLFRTIGLDSQQGATAADYIAQVVKPQRVAIIHDKQQYGKGVALIVRDRLQAAGVNVVSTDGINSGAKDFSSLITKLKREQVDFVYYGGYHPELALIMRQAKAVEFAPTFMGPEGLGNKDIAFLAGDAVEGLLVTLPARFDLQKDNQAVVELLKQKGADPSGPFIWTSYAAVQVLADAMQQVQSDTPADVAKALHDSTFETVLGPISWDVHGDLQGFEFGIYQWHADGTGTPVER